MIDEKNWVHPYLEALREQNDWMESTIPGLLNKKLDPFVVKRAHENLPKLEEACGVVGIEPTECEKAEIEAELERRTKVLMELNSAIREAMATRWKDHRKRLSDIIKARKYRENHKYAWVKYGELPAVLDTDKGRELLGRAINAGLLDNAYQPTSGTTNAQLCAIAMYVGDALDIRGKGFWEVFNSLWRKDHLQNTKWKPKDKQAKESKIQTVVNLFREYGEYPINGWK